jgi:hypothetical protein
VLEHWLPSVFLTLEELARLCRARGGSPGAFIEDQNSGTILLQQAARRGMPARAIESKLIAMGTDERAISVSGYVHQEMVKYSDRAFNKIVLYKQRSKNHLLDQVESLSVTATRRRTPAPAVVKMPCKVVAIEAMFSAPVGVMCGRATCSCADGRRHTTGQCKRQDG